MITARAQSERAQGILFDYFWSDMDITEVVEKWNIEYKEDGDGLEELWDLVDSDLAIPFMADEDRCFD